MVEEDSDKDKDDSSKDSHHHSNKDQQSLNADGSTSYSSSCRRHSAPKVLTPGANMSDIEEESVTSGHSQHSQIDGDTTPSSSGDSGGVGSVCAKGKGSPKNTSGVRIIIDHGSGSDEDSLDNCSAKDTLLDVTDVDEDYDDSRQRRISQFSEVQLLP